MAESARATDAILTVPNLLTFLRLALVPVFLWAGIVSENLGWAFAIAAVGFVTDLVDGKIARRFGQVSKLGIALDPLSDRLGLAAGAWVLLATDLAPVWAVVAVLARDGALVLVGAPLLKARGIPIPPVSPLGKKASFAVSMCFGLFLASGISSVTAPSRWVQDAAWVFFWLGVPAYYVVAAGYARAGMRSMRRKEDGEPRVD